MKPRQPSTGDRPGKLVGNNLGHTLVSFLAMGLVLGIWV